MPAWLQHIIRGNRRFPAPPSGAVLRILRQSLRADIQLLRWRDDGTPEIFEVTMIAVDRTGVVLSRPDEGSRIRPGETLELVLNGGGGRFRGRVRALGLGERPSGGQRPLPTIRLSIPARLEGGERRQSHRVSVGFDLAPTATLRDPESGRTWSSDIIDMSVEGMQLRSRPHAPSVAPGDVFWLGAELPPPAGELDCPVRIMNVRPDHRGDRDLFGVVLLERVPELEEFIRRAEIRRAARRRSA